LSVKLFQSASVSAPAASSSPEDRSRNKPSRMRVFSKDLANRNRRALAALNLRLPYARAPVVFFAQAGFPSRPIRPDGAARRGSTPTVWDSWQRGRRTDHVCPRMDRASLYWLTGQSAEPFPGTARGAGATAQAPAENLPTIPSSVQQISLVARPTVISAIGGRPGIYSYCRSAGGSIASIIRLPPRLQENVRCGFYLAACTGA